MNYVVLAIAKYPENAFRSERKPMGSQSAFRILFILNPVPDKKNSTKFPIDTNAR